MVKEEAEQEAIWPEQIETKEWFQKYASTIADFASQQVSPEDADQIHKGLAKFDPKFAALCKAAHDSAIAFMEYAKSKKEMK